MLPPSPTKSSATQSRKSTQSSSNQNIYIIPRTNPITRSSKTYSKDVKSNTKNKKINDGTKRNK